MNKSIKINIPFLIFLIIIIISWLYYSNYKKNQHVAPPPSLAEVKVIEISKKDVKLDFEYPAKVAGFREVEVKSQVGGILLQKLYQEGQIVKKNDLLFKIDPKPYEATLKKAKAQLSTAKSDFTKMEKAWNRAKILFKNKAISAQERDNSLASYENAEDAIKQAEADLRLAEINLSYTDIVSPIDGVSSKEAISEGNLINISDSVTKIVQNDLIYINFAYPENDFYRLQDLLSQNRTVIKASDKLTAVVKLADKIVSTGFVDFTDSNVDPSTSSVSSRVEVANTNLMLKSGQFVYVALDNIVLKDAIVIPEKSIIQTAKGPIIYVANSNNKIEIKPVKLDYLTKDGYVVESGVNPGEKLIVEGLIKVKPDQEVKVVNYIENDNK